MLIKEQKFASELLRDKLPNIQYGILSGPSFAKEMVLDQPTCVTLAMNDEKKAQEV